MRAFLNRKLVGKIIHWVLLTVIIVQTLSGFGIVYYRVIETISFGILTKAIAYKIHLYLIIPFLVILTAHIFFVLSRGKNKK